MELLGAFLLGLWVGYKIEEHFGKGDRDDVL